MCMWRVLTIWRCVFSHIAHACPLLPQSEVKLQKNFSTSPYISIYVKEEKQKLEQDVDIFQQVDVQHVLGWILFL